ncbi:hypothetical protein NDU88_002732 [Pleurodeles waltl]|uniref:Conserved oligomeric Golgi complex subunit 6 n=1 Tax=Pleurodeles waltl TaxID=8319 RepID=A0AAV7TLH2_PLEWA|nr:hypothetical protein NDU88_002732 [Pleurodeles waltl]
MVQPRRSPREPGLMSVGENKLTTDELGEAWGEIATEIKELKSDVAEMGQRVDRMQNTHDAQEEELDHYMQEILTLQESNHELQYRLEGLENRSWRSTIRIRRVPTGAMPGSLEDFVIRLFRHVAPALKAQEVILACTHRTGHLSQTRG